MSLANQLATSFVPGIGAFEGLPGIDAPGFTGSSSATSSAGPFAGGGVTFAGDTQTPLLVVAAIAIVALIIGLR